MPHLLVVWSLYCLTVMIMLRVVAMNWLVKVVQLMVMHKGVEVGVMVLVLKISITWLCLLIVMNYVLAQAMLFNWISLYLWKLFKQIMRLLLNWIWSMIIPIMISWMLMQNMRRREQIFALFYTSFQKYVLFCRNIHHMKLA